MVGTVNKLADKSNMGGPPTLVELVGSAGAGKSSLTRALNQCSERIAIGTYPEFRRIELIPFLVRSAHLLLLTFLRQYRNDRWLTRQEITRFVYLRGWRHVLRRQATNGVITLLDHGPVFKLTQLHAEGPAKLRDQGLDRWWSSLLKQWANTFDMFIWLDAPDEILLERVRARDRGHPLKAISGIEANEYLARYRTSYARIICALRENRGPRLLRFDTGQESLNQIVDKVLIAFDLRHRQG